MSGSVTIELQLTVELSGTARHAAPIRDQRLEAIDTSKGSDRD